MQTSAHGTLAVHNSSKLHLRVPMLGQMQPSRIQSDS